MKISDIMTEYDALNVAAYDARTKYMKYASNILKRALMYATVMPSTECKLPYRGFDSRVATQIHICVRDDAVHFEIEYPGYDCRDECHVMVVPACIIEMDEARFVAFCEKIIADKVAAESKRLQQRAADSARAAIERRRKLYESLKKEFNDA